MSWIDVPFILGLLMAAVGVTLIYLPAGLIVGGAMLAAVAFLAAGGDR